MQSLQIIAFPFVSLLSVFTVTMMNWVLLQILLKISTTRNGCVTLLIGRELHRLSIFLLCFLFSVPALPQALQFTVLLMDALQGAWSGSGERALIVEQQRSQKYDSSWACRIDGVQKWSEDQPQQFFLLFTLRSHSDIIISVNLFTYFQFYTLHHCLLFCGCLR